MSECNGAFKARKRGGLQNQIYELNKQIDNMKRYLSSIVQRHGYDNVRDFIVLIMRLKVNMLIM